MPTCLSTYFFNGRLHVQVGSGSVITGIWPPGSGFIIQDYRSADPDPKEIFTDPEHCLPFLLLTILLGCPMIVVNNTIVVQAGLTILSL